MSHDPDIVGSLLVFVRQAGHDGGEGEKTAALCKPAEKEEEEEGGGERERRRRTNPGGPMYSRGLS